MSSSQCRSFMSNILQSEGSKRLLSALDQEKIRAHLLTVTFLAALITRSHGTTPAYTGPTYGVVEWNSAVWDNTTACIGTSVQLPADTSVTLEVSDNAYADAIFLSEGSTLLITTDGVDLTIGAEWPNSTMDLENNMTCSMQSTSIGFSPTQNVATSPAVGMYVGIAIAFLSAVAIMATLFIIVRHRRRKAAGQLTDLGISSLQQRRSIHVELMVEELPMQSTFVFNDPDHEIEPRELTFGDQSHHKHPPEQSVTDEKIEEYSTPQLTTTQAPMDIADLRELYGVQEEDYVQGGAYSHLTNRNQSYINADAMDDQDDDIIYASLTKNSAQHHVQPNDLNGYVNADSHPDRSTNAYQVTLHPTASSTISSYANPRHDQQEEDHVHYESFQPKANYNLAQSSNSRSNTNPSDFELHNDYKLYDHERKLSQRVSNSIYASARVRSRNPYRHGDEEFDHYGPRAQAVSERAQGHDTDLLYTSYRREYLHFVGELGQGEFGVVLKAETTNGGKELARFVAVKTLKDNASDKEQADFLSEAKLLASFKHDNVLGLVGVCMPEQPWLIVIEFCPHGDLRNFLRLCVTCPGLSVTYVEQINMALQIAMGMEYLSSQSFVHRDLAARNCLVGQNSVIKVADFGLSRRVGDDEYYHVETRGKLPVRWMALESLEFRKFSSKTDVWSFGVVLWEIMTFGTAKPYKTMHLRDLTTRLREGKRLSRPRGCPEEMYTLMTQCWHIDARERPSFADLRAILGTRQHEQLHLGGNLRMLGNELEELTSSVL